MKRTSRSRNDFLRISLSSTLLVLSSIIIVVILDSNFQMGFLKEKFLPFNLKIIIFAIYVAVFILSSLILLIKTYNIVYRKEINLKYTKYYFIIIFIIFSILSLILIYTLMQILFLKNYNNIVFYLTSYISFISTLGFLTILTIQFFQWYLKGKNYLILIYGILFAIYSITLILALIYMISGLATHPSTINYSTPNQLRANTFSINIMFQNNIAIFYDIFFLVSFILAWLLTIFILKQYSQRIGKIRYWILVSLPLAFYLTRYEGIIFNYSQYFEFMKMPYIASIYTSLEEALVTSFINSEIQTSGLFFGLSFLPILLKLNKSNLKSYMNITLIGMVLLFIARDFYSIFLNSVPPGGVITISFMVIGSFLLFTGMKSFLTLAARDKEFYRLITKIVESDTKLLKNLIISEKEKELSKKIKPLMDYSLQWQKEQGYNLKNDELNQIIEDVISEFRGKKYLDFKPNDKSKDNNIDTQ